MIFLVFSVTFTLGIPGLGAHSASAAYQPVPKDEKLVFHEIKPKLNVVQNPILPELPKKEEAKTVVAKISSKTKVAVAKSTPVKATVAADGKTYSVTSTAYSSTVDQTDGNPFITASGSHVHFGTIACNFLPFGTKVMFPDYFGDKVFTVEDRTAKRFSNRADIWFPSRGEAIQFGKRTLRMVVVK
jgi:3D (Asp-Asp-Asp) domain-containing protein